MAITKKKGLSEKKVQKEKMASEANVQKIDPEQRCKMIEDAAYIIAEQRDFQGEDALADWLQAEANIDAELTNT